MKQRFTFLFICTIALFLASSCQSPVLKDEGPVVKVIDGDTYDLLINGEQVRVRMDGIDAPERGMDFYKVSKTYLGNLCMGKSIRLQRKEKDQYGRWVAKGFLPDGRELGLEMVKAGMAWHFKKYSDDRTLAAAEKDARLGKLGLWSVAEPVAPWDYRKLRKKKQ